MATEVISIPEGSAGANTVPAWYPAMMNGGYGGLGGGLGLGGWGGGILGFLIGLMFGNNGFGGGLFGGGNRGVGAGTAYLGNMISNDNGRELIMQAVTSQGEASRSAVQNLATMLGQDFNLLNSNIQTINQSLNTIAANQGMNALQVINAIQAGNASLASQFAQCCCENRLAMCQQTNSINEGFAGVQQSIAAKSAADQLSTCQQTYALTDTMNRNYLALDNKIDALESSRKDRELAAKDAEIATLKSQNFTAGIVQQAVAPINAQLAGLAKEVDDIKCKQPSTVSVQYPNLVAMNATPYVSGGFYPNNNGWNGWGGNVVF